MSKIINGVASEYDFPTTNELLIKFQKENEIKVDENLYLRKLYEEIIEKEKELDKYKEVLDKVLYWLSENTHYTDFNVDKLVLDENVNLKELLELLEEIE